MLFLLFIGGAKVKKLKATAGEKMDVSYIYHDCHERQVVELAVVRAMGSSAR